LTDRVELAGLSISDSPERWAALGFAIHDGERNVGGVRLTFGIAPPGRGIVGWTLSGLTEEQDIDRLATRVVPPASPKITADVGDRNMVREVDHVVIVTPDFDRLARILDARGMGLRRTAERAGRRQGFRRLGGPIMEVVEAPEAPATGFWGVTFTVAHLDLLVRDNRFVGEPRDAVQPGRRIATVSRDAGLSTRVAFMDPEPEPSPRS
jgi:hypothetical protein